MKIFRSGFSMPREEPKANQVGFIKEPLSIGQARTDGMVVSVIHFTEEPAVIGCQRWIVQTPVLKIIKVPEGNWQMVGYLHPMSLRLVVSMHRGALET
jgi:hypothetical protein